MELKMARGLFVNNFVIIVVFLPLNVLASREVHVGVVFAASAGQSKHNGSYCMMYNPDFHEVVQTLNEATKLPLIDLTSAENSLLCNDTAIPDLTSHAVAVTRGDCNFSQKAKLAQAHGANTLLVISHSGLTEPGLTNETEDKETINIAVAVMMDADFQHLTKLGPQVTVQLFAPPQSHFDYSLLVIWVVAIGTITVGSLWSGRTRHLQSQRSKAAREGRGSARGDAEEEDGPDTLDVSPKLIFIFVLLMCGMLLSLYFLYDYLVYAIIAMFVIASSMSLYNCIKPFMLRLTCLRDCRFSIRVPVIHRPEDGQLKCMLRRVVINIPRVVLGLLSLGVGVWWFMERHASYSWVLQDILGIAFCLFLLKTVRLPSLKACTVLLLLLFCYDVFFVFVTPYLTKSGESVMVSVATGGESHTNEALPMVLKVPRLSSSLTSRCTLPYSLLGFGDIVVPGMLLSYNYGFDLRVQSKGVYLIASVLAYGTGLIITFVALALMTIAQPALLYLVPCTVVTTVVIGWCRKELKMLWSGDLKTERPASDAVTNGTTAPPSGEPTEAEVNAPDGSSVDSQLSDSEAPLLVNQG